MTLYEPATVLIAVAALLISLLSWRTATKANIASTFDRRYEIYSIAEEFLGIWIRDRYPDLKALDELKRAWTRSHFLCRPEVTDYLRTVWLDAVEANRLHDVNKGNEQGDRIKSIRESHNLLLKHADFKRLREVMAPDLRVSNHWRWKMRYPDPKVK